MFSTTRSRPGSERDRRDRGRIMQRVKANPEVRHVLNVPFGTGSERASITDITPLTDQ